jgi:adenylate cyclase class IV
MEYKKTKKIFKMHNYKLSPLIIVIIFLAIIIFLCCCLFSKNNLLENAQSLFCTNGCIIISFFILASVLFESTSTSTSTLQTIINEGSGFTEGGGKEIEAKWLFVDREGLINKIKKLGATLEHGIAQYERYAFFLPPNDKRKGFVRTRKEKTKNGESVTITAKFYDQSNFADEFEIETKNSIEENKNLLEAFNFKQKAYQISFREKYHLKWKDCEYEICFDDWPGLSYVEIEIKGEGSEDNLKDLSKELGFKWEDARFGSFGNVYYEMYGIPQEDLNNKMKYIRFSHAEEDFKPFITKNKDKFKKILEEQRKFLKI